MKAAGVFGGSFNPIQNGHFSMADYFNKTLRPDSLTMIFSTNRLKDPDAYVSLEHRLEMARILSRHYPDIPLVLSDIENQIGTNETYHVLHALQAQSPDTRLIWIMGTDNLIGFDRWVKSDDIFNDFSIALINRPPYTDDPAAQATLARFRHLEKKKPEDLKDGTPGWILLDNPKIQISSTELLARLRAGETQFEGGFSDVADYIRLNRLYGLGPLPAAVPANNPASPHP